MALTVDEVQGLRQSATPEDAIRSQIYARHGIPAGTPTAEAIRLVQALAETRASNGADGGELSAWANPEERARAREAYAREGKTPAEVRQRWEESIYLLDPRTQQYMQDFGKDVDFLGSLAAAEQQPLTIDAGDAQEFDGSRGAGGRRASASAASQKNATPRRRGIPDAVNMYSRGVSYGTGSSDPRLAHSYQKFGGAVGSVVDAVSNPDTTLGSYMAASEVVPNYLRMQGSGESDSSGESYRAAQSQRLAANRHRINSLTPVLDLPEGATQAQIADRLRKLRDEVALASVPLAEERWQRTTGWTPPGWLADAGDFAISMVDPTIAVPAVKGAGALTNATKIMARGGRIAGSGWVAPLMKKATLPLAKGAAWDMASEQGVGAGLMAAIGGMPGRSGKQFAYGGGKPGEDFMYKSGGYVKGTGPIDNVAMARYARDKTYDRLREDESIEKADREAYSRLRADGTIPSPPQVYWGMSPSGPAY